MKLGADNRYLCNLKHTPEKLGELVYFSQVRSVLEYGSSILDSHLVKDINEAEKVQRAAQFVRGKYRSDERSVTEMIKHLGWSPSV